MRLAELAERRTYTELHGYFAQMQLLRRQSRSLQQLQLISFIRKETQDQAAVAVGKKVPSTVRNQ